MSYSATYTSIKEDGSDLTDKGLALSETPDENLWSLDNLPTDILLHIFAICGRDSWSVIAQVCRRFYIILGPESFLWEQIARQLLFVNQSSSNFQSKYMIKITLTSDLLTHFCL